MRLRSRRTFGLLAFTFMLLRIVAPELGHACAMDSKVSSATGETAAVSHDASASGGHAGHLGHSMPDEIHEATSSSPDESSPTTSTCECADWCCCIPALTHTPAESVVATTVTVHPLRVAVSPSQQPLPGVPHRLPFATAPPAV